VTRCDPSSSADRGRATTPISADTRWRRLRDPRQNASSYQQRSARSRGRTRCAAGGSRTHTDRRSGGPDFGLGASDSDLEPRRQGGALVAVVRWSCRSTRPGNLAAASPARVRLSSSDAFGCPEAGWAGDDRVAAYAGLRQAAIRRGCLTAAPRPTPSRQSRRPAVGCRSPRPILCAARSCTPR
jgi:hypothetical protein